MTTAFAAPLADPAAYNAAVDSALAACRAYYGPGDTTFSDADYDQLARQIREYELLHPEHLRKDSPIGKVGGGVATGDIAHTVPMLSLGNVYSAEELLKWEASLVRRVGGPVRGGYAVEGKFDGLAVTALYRDGRLVQLIKRGDHTKGEDVTHAVSLIDGLPTQLSAPLTVEIRGEVLLTRAQLAAANEIRRTHKARPFKNARAGAAGTLAAKNRPYRIELTFFAYSAIQLDGVPLTPAAPTHQALLSLVAEAGVQTSADSATGLRVVATLAEAQRRVEEIAEMRPDLPFGIDGVVVKANAVAEQEEAGNASDRPHWATAFKLPPETAETKVTAVEWNVGKTRIIAPRAVLEPVELDGSTVKFATLNNPQFIRDLGLMIGDTVVIAKAGDVIPQVLSVAADKRTGSETPVAFPASCPQCGGDVDTSGERWECAEGINGSCGALAGLIYAVGREQLHIEGLGDTYIEALFDMGVLSDVADYFTLTEEQLAEATGSAKRAKTVLGEIAKAKEQPLDRVLCSLGIVRTGRSVSKALARQFGTMDEVLAADAAALAQVTVRVNKVGSANAAKIAAHLQVLRPVIAKLEAAGVNMKQPDGPVKNTSGPLAGQAVVVTGGMTGPLAGRNRTAMNELIEAAGGEPAGSVTKKTTLLVAGENAGSKLAKAQQLGITVLNEEKFAERVANYLS
ncbi:NAD-dependent DNA ligase LigA [Streptomyces sp. NPDC091266]|uniref:NAD-dependent DNA ligase LigA n=1 Tax=Streptomyces sp. NPDC091266 TaxID=3365978 RepID=UPI003801846B